MDTERVREIALQMTNAEEAILEQGQALKSTMMGLEWISSSRDTFDAQMDWLVQQLRAMTDQCKDLAFRANAEADEWEQLDCKHAGNISTIKSYISALLLAGAARVLVGSIRRVSEQPLSATFFATEIPPLNYAVFSQCAYWDSPELPKELKGQCWEILGSSKDLGITSEGYAGVAYYNSQTGEVVIAHRGTDQWNFNPFNNRSSDVDDNLSNRIGQIPDQYEVSRQFVEKIKEKLSGDPQYGNYTLVHTGHSLGAALADLNALKDGSKGISFDNPGTLQIIRSHTEEFPLANRENLVSYQSNPNLVHLGGIPAGYTIQLIPKEGSTRISLNPIIQFSNTKQHHDLDNIINSMDRETGFPQGYFPPGTGGATHGSHNLEQFNNGQVSGTVGAPACYPPPALPSPYPI